MAVIASMEEVPVQTGIELGAECVESRLSSSVEAVVSPQQQPTPSVNLDSSNLYNGRSLGMEIPETSYSSSEDEDFYDASENTGYSPTLPT